MLNRIDMHKNDTAHQPRPPPPPPHTLAPAPLAPPPPPPPHSQTPVHFIKMICKLLDRSPVACSGLASLASNHWLSPLYVGSSPTSGKCWGPVSIWPWLLNVTYKLPALTFVKLLLHPIVCVYTHNCADTFWLSKRKHNLIYVSSRRVSGHF